jgi:hypothetical protein
VSDFAKDFISLEDGYYYWPPSGQVVFSADNLRAFADELDRKNKPWDDQVQAYFNEADQVSEAEVKCVNAHDRCFEGGPCPLCESVRYRDEQGRFAKPKEADQ